MAAVQTEPLVVLPSPVESLVPSFVVFAVVTFRGFLRELRRSRLGECPFPATWAAASDEEVQLAKKRNRKGRGEASLPVLQKNAAGIDIGATEIYVAVPADRDPTPVRCFPTFTQDLYALADWLTQCGIETVAMESTGVYWIPLFQILEDRGFQVCLVNARHVKNVPGRRTDVCDCQWLQFLHSVGLLRASYRPEQAVCAIRSLLRHRESLVQMSATHVQHMQKALDQMNLQLHHVISDITGYTGMAILDAILAGQRDPHALAKLRHERIKASEEVIAKSLVGDYRPEHLFTLRQSQTAYRSYLRMIADCDAEIERQLVAFDGPKDNSGSESRIVSDKRDPVDRGLRSELKRIFGVDLTKIPGIHVGHAQTLLGEVGPHMAKFRSASAFASWLGLCPDNDISGGKVLWTGTRRVSNRAATALRMAAQSLHHSQSGLGDFYRRMRARLGAPKAITAAAHRLARIIFHLITSRQDFDESRFAQGQLRFRKKQESRLRARAESMGFKLVPAGSVP